MPHNSQYRSLHEAFRERRCRQSTVLYHSDPAGYLLRQGPNLTVSIATSPCVDRDASLFDDQTAHAVSDEDNGSACRLICLAACSTPRKWCAKSHPDTLSILMERTQ